MLDTLKNTWGKISNYFKNTSIEQKFEDVKRGAESVGNFRQKIHDTLTGEDDNYRSLASRYDTPFQQKRTELIKQWQSKILSDDELEKQTKKINDEQSKLLQSSFAGQQFAKQKESIGRNIILASANEGATLTSKIAGKMGRVAAKVASSIVPDEIKIALKEFKIGDNLIEDLSKKLVNVNDIQTAYKIIRSSKIITDLEKKTGSVLDRPMKNRISEAVNEIYHSTLDEKTEKLALDKLSDDFVKSFDKSTERKVTEISSKVEQKTQDIIKNVPKSQPLQEGGSLIQEARKGEVYYHQTNATFDKFNSKDIAFFSPEKKPATYGKNTMEVKLDYKKPYEAGYWLPESELRAKIPALKKKGYDSVIYRGTAEDMSKPNTVVVFDPEKQVKIIPKSQTIADKRIPVSPKGKDLTTPFTSDGNIKSQPLQEGVKKVVKKETVKIPKKVTKVKPEEIKRKQSLKEVSSLLKSVREKGLMGRIKGDMRSLFVNNKGIPLKNIRNAVKNAPQEKLNKVKNILKNALDTTPKKIDVSKINWKKVEMPGESKGKTITKKIGEGIESAVGIVSTNIKKYGGEKLFSAIRERRYDINRLGKKYADEIKKFQKGLGKIKGKWIGGKENYKNLSHALFNQDFERAREIARKYKLEPELDKVIKVLDDIHARAKAVGLKVGKLENYFPRIVKDYDGLFKAYNEKFGQAGRSYLDKILTSVANSKLKKVSELTAEERADALTKALRGYGAGKINVGSVGKARQFKELPTEFMKYYHTPENSLTMYISKMNDRITLKKLFGLDDNEQDSIGALVDRLDISPNEMARLKENLAAVLSPQGQENWVLNKIRKSATLTLLGNVASTLFQIADIGVNAYKHGSLRALASLIRSKPFKRDELFTEIAHEFADSNVIKNTLKAVGFDRLDRLNNEAFMGNAFREAVRYVRKGKGSGFNKVKEYANVVFRGDENRIAKFLDDVKNKRVTDETGLYVFNKVLDVQPRAIEEMPEAYAKHPNARMFYSMKSYGLKVLDIYRNDVVREKKTLTKAKNAIRLTALLTLSGATGSQIRDWYNGKDTKFSDNVMNNLFNISMFSTYDAANIKREGPFMAILKKIAPPSRWITDVSQDIVSAGDGEGLKSVRNIPIIGNEIYNRIGKGKESIAKAADTTAKHYENVKKMIPVDQKKALLELRKTQPRKYTAVVKQMKWDRMGVTDKEKGFSKLGVEDGERADAIAAYLQKQPDWKAAYGKLRKAGIITDDVRKQLAPELKLLMNK